MRRAKRRRDRYVVRVHTIGGTWFQWTFVTPTAAEAHITTIRETGFTDEHADKHGRDLYLPNSIARIELRNPL